MGYLTRNINEYYADRIIMGYEKNKHIPMAFDHETQGRVLRVSMMINDGLWPKTLIKNQSEFKKTAAQKQNLKLLKKEYREKMRNSISGFTNKSDHYTNFIVPGLGTVKKTDKNDL